MNHALTEHIKEQAIELGFHKIGIAHPEILPKSRFLTEWLAAGYHGSMGWMENYLEKRMDIRRLYPDVQSVVVLAHNYYTGHPQSGDQHTGKISRYAWGLDYHKILKKKLKKLLQSVREPFPEVEGRLFVDTGPVQEKLWAEAAGIGWQGKNTNILTREYGSWIFLGILLINAELEYDSPVPDRCGSCTACIDACPTHALQSYVLDATKCISYLTIEHRGKPVPETFHGTMENWIFGCDICQEVCPWNKFRKETEEEAFQPRPGNVSPKLDELLRMDETAFKNRFGKSPLNRISHDDFIRNVKIAKKDL